MEELSMRELRSRILWLAYLIYHDVLSKSPEEIKNLHMPYPSYCQVEEDGMLFQIMFLRYEPERPGFEDVCRCRLIVISNKLSYSFNVEVRFYAYTSTQCVAYAWNPEDKRQYLLFDSDIKAIYLVLESVAKKRGLCNINFP